MRSLVGGLLIALVTMRVYAAALHEAGVRRRTGIPDACTDHVPAAAQGWQLDQDLRWAPPELTCTWTDPATAQVITVTPTQPSAAIYFWVAVLALIGLVAWVVLAFRWGNNPPRPGPGAKP